MNGWTLQLHTPPAVRADLRGLTPQALATLGADEVERLSVGHGRHRVPLAEFFRVAPGEPGTLRLQGDLSRFDRVGWQLDGGALVVEGSVGDHAGGLMRAGRLHIGGSAGALLACEMAGGELRVDGDVGDFAAAPLPGSLDGMRGGTLVVGGRAGHRFADRMRRGTAIVFGDVGDFLASRLVAGTVVLGGCAGAHAGWGMRRGSLVFARGAEAVSQVPPTFVPAGAEAPVFWQLLSRDLARHGGPCAGLGQRPITRHLGDVAVGGKGEWIFPS